MKFFKQPNGTIRAFEKDGSQDFLITEDMQPLTEAEAMAELAPPAPSLDELKAAKIAEINATSQAFVDSVTAGYPEFEIQTWGKQEAEAMAWHEDPLAPTPTIDRMAARRKLDREEYLQRTYNKVQAFELVYDIVGDRQYYADLAAAAETPEALAAIVPVFPIPEPEPVVEEPAPEPEQPAE